MSKRRVMKMPETEGRICGQSATTWEARSLGPRYRMVGWSRMIRPACSLMILAVVQRGATEKCETPKLSPRVQGERGPGPANIG